jgi:hypothetical protein
VSQFTPLDFTPLPLSEALNAAIRRYAAARASLARDSALIKCGHIPRPRWEATLSDFDACEEVLVALMRAAGLRVVESGNWLIIDMERASDRPDPQGFGLCCLAPWEVGRAAGPAVESSRQDDKIAATSP